MHRRAWTRLVVLSACLAVLGFAWAAHAARPGGPLTCHKQVCPLPGPCQVRESESCLKGGGPPRCPAIVNAADGTACNDGSVCTVGDVCTAGVCGGQPAACSSSTDTCEPTSGCATTCGPGGCVVSAAGGEGDPTLTVPAGALAGDVRISMLDLGPDPADPSVFRVYEFTPDGTTFSTPATVDLPAPPLGPGQVVILEVTEGAGWVEIPSTLEGDRVRGSISHFSRCRSRVVSPPSGADLVMVDLVEYQDLNNILNPNGLVRAGCDPGAELYGICLTVRNTSNTSPIANATANVFLWQCYQNSGNYPFTDPATGQFEGEHCSTSSLVLPCFNGQPLQVQLTFSPPLGPQQTTNVPFTIPPSAGCHDGSTFLGVDVTFREPTIANPASGMRSANVGPPVNGQPFRGLLPLEKFDNNGKRIKNFLIDARF